MKIARNSLFFSVVVLLVAAPYCHAEGFSFAKLIPSFGPKKTSPKSAVRRTSYEAERLARPVQHDRAKKSMFSLPKLPTFSGTSSLRLPTLPTPQVPAVVKKMNASTKRFVSETASMLSPSKLPKPRFPRFGNSSKQTSKKQGNILTSWFGPSKPTPRKKPKTTKDFLSQDRVPF